MATTTKRAAKKTVARGRAAAPKAETPEPNTVEVDDDAVMDPVPNKGPGHDVVDESAESTATTAADLGFNIPSQEIEVERVIERREVDPNGMVEVRMARTIEEFTYGNPHVNYTLTEGKRYRIPLHVAEYLNGLGAVLHHN